MGTADANTRCCIAQADGGTPLWAACEAGHLAVVNALIESHANVNSAPVETVGAGRMAPAVGCVRWGVSSVLLSSREGLSARPTSVSDCTISNKHTRRYARRCTITCSGDPPWSMQRSPPARNARRKAAAHGTASLAYGSSAASALKAARHSRCDTLLLSHAL